MSQPAAAVPPTPLRAVDEPVLIGRPSDREITEQLLGPIWTGHKMYAPLLALTGLGALMMVTSLFYTFLAGIGTWGNNIPVGWGYAITNFVWWIGIGHAGTFISAILLLAEQKWRTSINRFAEAMTLFAVVQAGTYPIAHLGRAWFAYWLIPYPATMGVWPNFRSSLVWDVFAVSTYATISLLFWYLGLIPDLASARDMAPTRLKKKIYGIFSWGWRGSVRHWSRLRVGYGLLAGMATPLVLSVHSIVSLDFAIGKVPGWHSTIFPPFFVAGAIYSGFAMVLTLLIPFRHILKFNNVVTKAHLDAMAKILLVTGSIVGYSYIVEDFLAWYSGDKAEIFTLLIGGPLGSYAVVWWGMLACNVVLPQTLWIKKFRQNDVILFIITLGVNFGMWTERFMIVAGSLSHGFLPSSWHVYQPSIVDWGLFLGTLSLFTFLFLLFLRFVPFIPMYEVKELRHHLAHEDHAEGGAHGHLAAG